LDRLQGARISGQRVLMVRGAGGRTLLADTLRDRGALVEHAVVYQRQRPLLDPEPVLDCWARGAIGAVIVTSDESLRNLFDMLGATGQDYLRATPLIVVSTRTRQTATEYGCRHLLLAQDASDAALTAVLLSLTAHPSSLPGNTI
ncbi:MAG TPA: uroporphyrinogen-III synthase, partial [Candidatus Competibacteraceae bacterium]|nr:uroporphyrinogen-III synthase [Candidatus Competibacteraceae bacterium]